MFIDRLFNQTNAPLLERVIQFTEKRHTLIAENIANADTPGYRQKDLSVDKFNEALSRRVEQMHAAAPGMVGFGDVEADEINPNNAILFHDGNNRSMEQLQTDLAKNALTHNMAVELLRKQYSTMEMALRERVS